MNKLNFWGFPLHKHQASKQRFLIIMSVEITENTFILLVCYTESLFLSERIHKLLFWNHTKANLLEHLFT